MPVLSIGIAIYLSRIIVNPLLAVVGRIEEIADGHLEGKLLQIKTGDELQVLGDAANKMTANLNGLIQPVIGTTEELFSAADNMIKSANNTKEGVVN